MYYVYTYKITTRAVSTTNLTFFTKRTAKKMIIFYYTRVKFWVRCWVLCGVIIHQIESTNASIVSIKVHTRNIFKKIFVGSQILTINATKFAGLDEILIYHICMLESKTSEVVVLFLSLFCLVLCTSYSFRLAICIQSFFLILRIYQQEFGNNVLSPKFLGKWGGGVLTIN